MAATDARRAGHALEPLEGVNPLGVPLDRQREWYPPVPRPAQGGTQATRARADPAAPSPGGSLVRDQRLPELARPSSSSHAPTLRSPRVAGARILLREVRYILQQRPRLGILPTQADQPQSKLDSLRETTPSATTLTPLSCDSCHCSRPTSPSGRSASDSTSRRTRSSPRRSRSTANSASHPGARRSSTCSRPACSVRRWWQETRQAADPSRHARPHPAH